MRFSDNSMALLEKRYLENETVDGMLDRASGGDPRFRKLMAEQRFMPNSPTLFNAGRNNGCTLSACFVFDIEDKMLHNDDGSISENSILRTREKAAMVAKAGGGVGYYGGDIRPKGSLIKSVQRRACGPVAVLWDMQGISELITQGGKRELAQMFVLPVWHDDIREFIHVKDEDPQKLRSFNISVGWPDHHVSCVRAKDQLWSSLWYEQVDSAWSHGCPGMWFPDAVNRANPNPHLGLMNAPNPCGETPNRNNEPCNLGSLSLPRYFGAGNRGVDWKLLEEDVWTATLFLDDILDRNTFPHPDIAAASLLTRKLGLGVMGWADLLAMMHIHYDTQQAVDLGAKLMGFIQEVSVAASEHLMHEKGPYKGYSETRTQHAPRRNETTTSVAPTGSIGVIVDVLGKGIEPWYAYCNSRVTGDGMKFVERVPEWVDEHVGDFRPKTAHEVHWEWHVAHQAAFQRSTHLGVSKTINMPNSATRADVDTAYRRMHQEGCKGGTVYRDECRPDQVLRKVGSSQWSRGAELPKRRCLPDERPGRTHKLRVGSTKFYLTVNCYDDGSPGELFVNGDFGSALGGLLDSFCIAFSVALQHGAPLESLTGPHKGKRFEPNGQTNFSEVPLCTSIIDLIVRVLEKKHLKEPTQERSTGVLCSECGAVAVLQEGCWRCVSPGCGWSKCG